MGKTGRRLFNFVIIVAYFRYIWAAQTSDVASLSSLL
uniref:Uncharacterized protein n=1 Tax=Rhizophora mucronata TaxID=61149 RepID=A0A2P2P7M4_RHIMU